MIDAIGQDAPDCIDQAELDASLTLHEAKKWGYWPGETPGTAEEYMVGIRARQEITAKWRAALTEAYDRGADAVELEQMHRGHAAEIDEQDELWFHRRVRPILSPVPKTMRPKISARVQALF